LSAVLEIAPVMKAADCEHLAERALTQQHRVEMLRIAVAKIAFV